MLKIPLNELSPKVVAHKTAFLKEDYNIWISKFTVEAIDYFFSTISNILNEEEILELSFRKIHSILSIFTFDIFHTLII